MKSKYPWVAPCHLDSPEPDSVLYTFMFRGPCTDVEDIDNVVDPSFDFIAMSNRDYWLMDTFVSRKTDNVGNVACMNTELLLRGY